MDVRALTCMVMFVTRTRPYLVLVLLFAVSSCAFGTDTTPTPATSMRERSSPEPRRDAVHRRGARRVEQTRLVADVMPIHERYHPLIASTAMGSIAVGTVTEGYLARSVEVPLDGPNHAVLAKIRDRHTRFTSDEMKGLLMCVAERVRAKHPDHKLLLGNLSRRSGGDIPWSVSHNNGRDADLAFLSRRPDGTAATPDFLYHFGNKLEASDSPEPLIFDVAANWTMIKALLQCPKAAPVQKLFIARWLRDLILRYARAAKEPDSVRYAAANMMRQPRRTSPHADHLHLRIGCAPDDEAEGCLDRGRAPVDAMGEQRAVQRRLPAIRREFGAPDASRRAGAAYLAGLYFDRQSIPGLSRLLLDPADDVQIRAAEALVHMGQHDQAERIDAALSRTSSVRVAQRLLSCLARLDATEQLTRRLSDPRLLVSDERRAPIRVRELALQMVEQTDSLAAVLAVVPLLSDPSHAVRRQAHRTLGRLVNRTTADLVLEFAAALSQDGVGVSVPLEPVEQQALWRRYLATIPPNATRDEVVLDGFRARGLPISGLDRDNLDNLAIALSWERPYSDNAARAIARAIDYFPELGRGARAQPRAFWVPFLARRHMIDVDVVARGVQAVDTLLAASRVPGEPQPINGAATAHEPSASRQ